MKKSNLFLTSLFAAALLVSCGGNTNQTENAETETVETESVEAADVAVNLAESKVMWKGAMLGIKFHEGLVNLTEASLTMAGNTIVGGSFTIDMTTMVATDENFNPEEGSTKEKLIGHLSSDDFFNVAEYPTANFVVTSVSDDGKTLTGNLTVRGITNEETVTNVEVIDGAVTGSLTFDRKKYDVKWDSPMKDVVLSNDIEIMVKLAI